MGRTLHYKIEDDGKNFVTNEEWEQIARLQHWYNSEFIWTCGRLALKMFSVFPNWDRFEDTNEVNVISAIIRQRQSELRESGLKYKDIILQLEQEGFVIVKKGGYLDNCIASGFTKVAGNEWNAYLVCEFLLKCSLMVPHVEFVVYDEGGFIKCKEVRMKDGVVRAVLEKKDQPKFHWLELKKRVFSVVDPSTYDHHPQLKTVVLNFNDLENDEKLDILHDWNWLGFGDNYDKDGDDLEGCDLNQKARAIEFTWV